MAWPCRCLKCEARRTLAKKPSDYKRPPACNVCKGRKYYICKDRLPGRWGKKHLCYCGAYWFPHRKGSGCCYERQNWEEHNQRLRGYESTEEAPNVYDSWDMGGRETSTADGSIPF